MKVTQLAISLISLYSQESLVNAFFTPSSISTHHHHNHAFISNININININTRQSQSTPISKTSTSSSSSTTELNAKKKKKTKKKTTTSTAGLKGFGSTTTTSATSTITVPIDRSKSAMDFYSFLESNGVGTSLKRVALGFFPFDYEDKDDGDNNNNDNGDNDNGDKKERNTETMLRGVVALKKIPKGDVIIEIPYEAAWNLGKENSDPTLPGTIVLQEYCNYLTGGNNNDGKNKEGRDLGPYLAMLPKYNSVDVLGSTDFFSDEALDMLQSPHEIKAETMGRREKTKARYERDVEPMLEISSNMYRWKDKDTSSSSKGSDEIVKVTEEHLQWAVWLVTSRVLTVQGDAETNESFRLMIPLIDMCNHDRNSPHVLTGRAVPGGTLKVVAGKTVEAGEQVNIVYGGGAIGNDRFVQDYGFLDVLDGGEAYDITGKILMGKRRIVEGSGARGGRPTLMPEDERVRALEVLEETSLEDDLALLMNEGEKMANDVKCALEYRIGIKKALKRLGYGLMAP